MWDAGGTRPYRSFGANGVRGVGLLFGADGGFTIRRRLSKVAAGWIRRGQLYEIAANWEAAMDRAAGLAEKHTASLGTRSADLLHLAFALELEAEVFFSTDACQAEAASAEGLKVVTLGEFEV